MSASNWGNCPLCKIKAEQEKETQRGRAARSYGKVPADEFISLVAASREEISLDSTLREDYEIGVDEEGTFWVSYRCECGDCGFSHSFRHEEKLEVGEKEPGSRLVGGVSDGTG